MIPLYRHSLGANEVQAVAEALKSPFLTKNPQSNAFDGTFLATFERKFAAYLGTKHAVGVTNATMALFLTLKALGIKRGDEIITTPLTYIATAQAIIHAGAKPVFVDVEEETGNLDFSLVAERARKSKPKAILPVHLYGWMCDMASFAEFEDYGISVVEDAAHCLEGSRDGYRPGQLSSAACFSFYPTKSITCGQGGAVATNRGDLEYRIKRLAHHATIRQPNGTYQAKQVGYNAVLDNIRAAMLVAQMDGIGDRHELRCVNGSYYLRLLGDVVRFFSPHCAPQDRWGWHLMPIRVPADQRDNLQAFLKERGIETGIHYQSLTELAYFKKRYPASCPIAERIGRETLSLPFWPGMPVEDIQTVCNAIGEYFDGRPDRSGVRQQLHAGSQGAGELSA